MSTVPNPVTHSSARLLEFETLRALLAGYASSPLGQRRVAELLPSLDRAWIETQQQLTTEIREYRRVGGRFEFLGLPEVGELIEKKLLDEAFITISSVIAGRGREMRYGMVEGNQVLPARHLWSRLLSARRSGDFLFLRYGLKT